MPPTQEEMTEWMNAWYENPPSRDELMEAWHEFGRPAGWTDHGNFEYIGQYPLGAFVLGDYLEFTGDAGRAIRWARVEEAMERGLILRRFDGYHEEEEEDEEDDDEGEDGDDKDDGRGRGSGQGKRGGRGGSRRGRGGLSAGQAKRGRGRPRGSTKGSTKA